MPPTVAVVSQQPLFGLALRRLLTEPPIRAHVSLTAAGEGEMPALPADVDVLILDIAADPQSAHRPPPGGWPAAPRLLIGDSIDGRMLIEALRTGARGVLTREATVDQLAFAIDGLAAGHGAISDGILRNLLEMAASPPQREAPPLSPTEIAILELIVEAKSIFTIAKQRGISQKTVRNHLARIYRKLGVRSRSEAMLAAMRLGIMS